MCALGLSAGLSNKEWPCQRCSNHGPTSRVLVPLYRNAPEAPNDQAARLIHLVGLHPGAAPSTGLGGIALLPEIRIGV